VCSLYDTVHPYRDHIIRIIYKCLILCCIKDSVNKIYIITPKDTPPESMSLTSTIAYGKHTLQILTEIVRPNEQRRPHAEILGALRYIAWYTSATQFLLLVIIMSVGTPGTYTEHHGFFYISDNFCTKKILSIAFMLSTLPTWALLACSISLEPTKWKRTSLLVLMSVPLPTGIGIVLFSLCETPGLHYTYVNLFVGTTACIHITVGYTARHFKFVQCYSALVFGTAICGIVFIALAMFETGKGSRRDSAVIMEYVSVTGFIVLNSLSVDRIAEHLKVM
jgi:hypothetical protein